MLPYSNYSPALQHEGFIIAEVPFDIGIDFGSPKFRSCFWKSKVLRAFMPEAAVHEHYRLETPKDYIRFSIQFSIHAITVSLMPKSLS